MNLISKNINYETITPYRSFSEYLKNEKLFSSNRLDWKKLINSRPSPLLDEHIVEGIVEHQKRWGGDEKAVENARALGEKGTYCVIAGQQPGLLLGPIYTLFKALSAVALSKRIEAENEGVRVVPIFWNASDDSDLQEIDKVYLLDKTGSPTTFEMGMAQFEKGTMIGSLGADAVDFAALKSWMQESFFDTEFLPDLFGAIDETYRESTRLSEWFNRLLHLLTGSGLVVFENSLFSMKKITRRLWKPHLKQPGLLTQLLEQQKEALSEAGLKSRVEKWPEDTGWFLLDGSQRYPIALEQGKLSATGREIDLGALLDDPSIDIKPSAALRPILQDMLFPNLATITGPNELEYHAQLEPLYRYHDVFRPKVLLRYSGAVVEKKIDHFLGEDNLDVFDMAKPARELEKKLFKHGPGQKLEQWRDKTLSQLNALFKELDPVIEELGQDLPNSLGKKRRRIEKEIQSIEDILVRRISQKDEVAKSRLEKAKNLLFPNDQWQERYLNIFYFVSKYGPDFLEQLTGVIDENFSQEPQFSILTIK